MAKKQKRKTTARKKAVVSKRKSNEKKVLKRGKRKSPESNKSKPSNAGRPLKRSVSKTGPRAKRSDSKKSITDIRANRVRTVRGFEKKYTDKNGVVRFRDSKGHFASKEITEEILRQARKFEKQRESFNLNDILEGKKVKRGKKTKEIGGVDMQLTEITEEDTHTHSVIVTIDSKGTSRTLYRIISLKARFLSPSTYVTVLRDLKNDSTVTEGERNSQVRNINESEMLRAVASDEVFETRSKTDAILYVEEQNDILYDIIEILKDSGVEGESIDSPEFSIPLLTEEVIKTGEVVFIQVDYSRAHLNGLSREKFKNTINDFIKGGLI